MCILFIYKGNEESDYSLILATNRDEFYNRPAIKMVPWTEDTTVVGGRDLEAGGTWLAASTLHKKLGIILNLPENNKLNAKTRGQIVSNFVKCHKTSEQYIAESLKSYGKDCNGFIFITVEFGSPENIVQSYDNITGEHKTWNEDCLGFGNSLPQFPLTKVKGGKEIFRQICQSLSKVEQKIELIDELIHFLKSEQRYLPDPQLEKRQPNMYEKLSSIFVSIPDGNYGTRTHTLVLLTKTGLLDLIEITAEAPIDVKNISWERSDFQCKI